MYIHNNTDALKSTLSAKQPPLTRQLISSQPQHRTQNSSFQLSHFQKGLYPFITRRNKRM